MLLLSRRLYVVQSAFRPCQNGTHFHFADQLLYLVVESDPYLLCQLQHSEYERLLFGQDALGSVADQLHYDGFPVGLVQFYVGTEQHEISQSLLEGAFLS